MAEQPAQRGHLLSTLPLFLGEHTKRLEWLYTGSEKDVTPFQGMGLTVGCSDPCCF